MKRHLIRTGLCALLVVPMLGCNALLDILRFRQVTVTLVNNGDYDVEATLYYHDNQDIPRLLLRDLGDKVEVTIAPGEQHTFRRDCDDLQAIMVYDADLLVVGSLFGPSTSSGVSRDGSDFRCGDRIIYTFDHSGVLIDFGVSRRVESF